MSAKLSGRRVLVVEDQYLIADEVVRIVREAGAVVVGPAPGGEQALKTLREAEVDAGVLDIHLGDETVYDVASELRRRSIPFLFLTGYDRRAVRSDFVGTPHIDKPFAAGDLVRAIRDLTAR